jgi:hypothetical protein
MRQTTEKVPQKYRLIYQKKSWVLRRYALSIIAKGNFRAPHSTRKKQGHHKGIPAFFVGVCLGSDPSYRGPREFPILGESEYLRLLYKLRSSAVVASRRRARAPHSTRRREPKWLSLRVYGGISHHDRGGLSRFARTIIAQAQFSSPTIRGA